jgi:hypothetical protein
MTSIILALMGIICLILTVFDLVEEICSYEVHIWYCFADFVIIVVWIILLINLFR